MERMKQFFKRFLPNNKQFKILMVGTSVGLSCVGIGLSSADISYALKQMGFYGYEYLLWVATGFSLFSIVKWVGSALRIRDDMVESYTDEQKLLNVKRKFLDQILEKLKLEIDKDLLQSLDNGDIEEANSHIEDKINALNKLVETVKGNNAKVLRGTDISTVSNLYDSTNNRIKEEISRIRGNSSLNMWIGVIASVSAIVLLVTTIQEHEKDLMILIPRATVSILIEAFAFFFFSQYRKQQEEIKYWNNEKTNLDLKIFALSLAIDDEEIGTKDYMRNLITTLIQSNRNIFGSTPGEIKDEKSKEEKPKEPTEDKTIITEIFSKAKDLTELIAKNKDLLNITK
jgi:hypothetical protein